MDADPKAAPEDGRATRKGIRSVEIGLRVLDALVRADGPLALKDISKVAALSASQTHRYLASLIRSDMVVQDPATGFYDLGNMALRVGLAALNRLDAVQVAEQGLETLVKRMDQTAMLAVWGERGPVAVRWRRGKSLLFTTVGVGTTFPLLSSTTGRLYLAFMPPAVTGPVLEAELREAEAAGRPVDRRELDAITAEIRARRLVIMEGHLVPGVWAATAPVLDAQGELVACYTIIGGATDPQPRRDADIEQLVLTAAEMSERLGHQPSEAARAQT